jgi:small subunit ribosomal protein S20
MPVIKSAIKKLRKDKKRTVANDLLRDQLQRAVKIAKRSGTAADVQAAFSVVDKAAKMHLIHANKAARVKSRLSTLGTLSKTAGEKIAEKSVKRPTKRKSVTKASASA